MIGTNGVVPQTTDLLYRKASASGLPISGTFELTPMCNFACKMCYVRLSAEQVRASGRKQRTLEDWLHLAEAAGKQGMLFVLLTGGEPLSVSWFPELYERLCAMGMLVTINTNGSLIDDRMVELFRRCPPRRICLTLYGASDETYERLCGVKNMFARVDAAITKLRQAGITLKLNCSLTPYNVCDLPAMVRYAQERELILDTTTYMFPPLRRDAASVGKNDRFTPEEAAKWRLEAYRLLYGEERYHAFLRQIRDGLIPPPGLEEGCIDPVDGKVRCRAGKACFWATWDGWLLPCGQMTKPKLDLEAEDFDALWQQLLVVSAEIRTSGVCDGCKNARLCNVCAAMALTETGAFSGIPTYLCHTVAAMRRLAAYALQGE